jgi:hypothetical protein
LKLGLNISLIIRAFWIFYDAFGIEIDHFWVIHVGSPIRSQQT